MVTLASYRSEFSQPVIVRMPFKACLETTQGLSGSSLLEMFQEASPPFQTRVQTQSN